MNLTFVTDLGETFPVEIDPNMEFENVMALLEAEVRPSSLIAQQLTSLAHRLPPDAVRDPSPRTKTIAQDAETMRLQILGNPQLMQQLRDREPAIAEAAVDNPQRFAELLRQTAEAKQAREREMAMLEADPFNPEAQQKIEEIIRQQAVLENMQHAIEYSPESFGIVTML
ncbi:hypothetical protein C0992_003573 [Termitomyces sp. T32_za158]|nr:hypothetical protein C0992_003573 [Termitomyces sp. T32_za158]